MIAHPAEAGIASAYLRLARNPAQSGATEGAMRSSARDDRLEMASRASPRAIRLDRSSIRSGMGAMDDPRIDPSERTDALSGCILRIASLRDEAAFETLFRHFAPRLKSYFTKLGGDPATAEEITQEAMVAVWKNAGQFDPAKASAATWIFTVARNLSIDRFRQARRPTFDPNDPAFIPDEEEPPDRQIERAEAELKVREVMNSLSPHEQSVLMLSFYENHSHGEIAQLLGLPVGTVKSRIRLAFGKLRAALDPQPGAGR
jgi:RNA polymerase sigma-70 factor (ECF subfamily)